jgi:hypothetical protein
MKTDDYEEIMSENDLMFEICDINAIISHQMRRVHQEMSQFIYYQEAAKEKFIEQWVRLNAVPKIKGQITKKKLRWRGIKFVLYGFNLFYIMQRGRRISPDLNLNHSVKVV